MDQWLYEVTSGGRLRYLIDDATKTVWLIQSAPAIPRTASERGPCAWMRSAVAKLPHARTPRMVTIGHMSSPGMGRRRRSVASLESPRVLVCDDTDSVRSLIVMNLELEGYDVVEARDGQEALDILRDPAAQLPDVITVDALMPRRDGWWTVAMIRADPELEHLPVVMVTASVQGHHRAQAEQASVDAFIAKPFDPDELVAIVGVLAAGGRVR